MMHDDKFRLQDALYEFPYHYLPAIERGRAIRLHRQLVWGLDYMTYMSFLAELVEKLGPESLLDVGCGDGRFVYMIKHIVPLVRGVDLSERAIAFARAFNPDIEFMARDISKVSDRYQVVTLIEVLEHVSDEEMPSFLRSVRMCIEDGGYLLLSVPTVNVPLNKKHHRHYSLEVVVSSIETAFQIEAHWWLYRSCLLERFLRKALCNPLFTLNYSLARTWVWRLHKSLTYNASSSSGSHLVCLARPK